MWLDGSCPDHWQVEPFLGSFFIQGHFLVSDATCLSNITAIWRMESLQLFFLFCISPKNFQKLTENANSYLFNCSFNYYWVDDIFINFVSDTDVTEYGDENGTEHVSSVGEFFPFLMHEHTLRSYRHSSYY